MVVRGRVKNGVVVLEKTGCLPEGAEVSVRQLKDKPKATNGKKRRITVKPGLLKLAGKAKGLPPDASQNVEKFLYGDAQP
jgi:hypothetical protein